jgi:hypothetical protein
MREHYFGDMDGQLVGANKPFALRGWPAQTDIKEFDTESDTRAFIKSVPGHDRAFVGFAILYAFKEGKWEAI